MIDTIIGAALEVATDTDREWAAARPDRSVSAVRDASRVPSRWRAFASCVLHRESGATLDRVQSGVGALNGSSSAAGRWQMLRPWQDGGAWNVQKRLIRFGADRSQAVKVRVYLQRTPIHRWHGVWQDMAAFEAMEHGGWRAWANGDRCDGLVPR